MSKGDETRQRIIEEAAAMFNQYGYEGASLARLMEATGLQKGGIYRHFTSKEELAAEAFDYAWNAARELRIKDLDESAGAIAQLKQLVANFVGKRGPVPGGCPLLNTAVDSDDGNSVLRDRVRKALAEWKARLVRIMKEGIAAGEIRKGVDPEVKATVIIASLEGALMISRLNRSLSALKTIEASLNEFLDGLKA
jgi:TetR/AcrR family transcriptional repressor of nem operon